MAGNDKPNLSDLKARLSFRLGEQKAVQSPAPTPQQGQQASPAVPNQGGQQQAYDPNRQTGASRQQPQYQTGGGAFSQQDQSANPYGAQQQQAYGAQQQAAYGGQQQGGQQQGGQQQGGQQQRQPRPTGNQQPQSSGAQNAHQPGGAASKGSQNAQKGGLKDLQASFDSNKETFKPLAGPSEVEFRGNPIITTGGIVIAAACLIFGIVATAMYSSGSEKRQLFTMQIKDANEAFDALNPKVTAFKELQDAVSKLDPKKIDFNQLKKIGQIDFVVNGSPFNSNRVLLGGKIISPVIRYMTDSSLIKAQVDDLVSLANSDKDELEALGGKGPLGTYDYFGVIFNYEAACRDGKKGSYVPSPGTFVGVANPKPDSDGEFTGKILGSSEERKFKARFFIPINKDSVISAQGPGNALERYTRALNALKRRVASVDYVDSMLSNIETVAKEPKPGLFSF